MMSSMSPLYQLPVLLLLLLQVLVDTHIEVRSAALRLIRYLCVDATTVSEIYHRRLDVFFVISLEVENTKDLERRQAMQIIRQCIQIDPSSVTDTIGSTYYAIKAPHDKCRPSCHHLCLSVCIYVSLARSLFECVCRMVLVWLGSSICFVFVSISFSHSSLL